MFPFFEGIETPTGLFIVHALTLLLAGTAVWTKSEIRVPGFLVYFVPFFISILVSAILAPYKYAAFLELWDYCIAGILCIVLFSWMKGMPEKHSILIFSCFVIGSLSTFISVLFAESSQLPRTSGTFVNPNHFGTFCLLLMLLGVFLLEHESQRAKKWVISVCLSGLIICMIIVFSRSVLAAFLVLSVLYLWQRKPGKRTMLVIGSLLLISVIALVYRFQSPDPFKYYRLKIWKHSLAALGNNPYLGIGLNMLPHVASRFNFPADVEVGRFARIARTADSQYVEVLVESGFLGLGTFLLGWIALYFSHQSPTNGPYFPKQAHLALSIIALFSVPLNNTSVVYLFLFLVVFALVINPAQKSTVVNLNAVGRGAMSAVIVLLLIFVVFFPFAADYWFKKAVMAKDNSVAHKALNKAVSYNPYQPYYEFFFVRRLVDAKPKLEAAQWAHLLQLVNNSITLNPNEADFYVYRARIYSSFLRNFHRLDYNSRVISSYQNALDLQPFNVFLRAEYTVFLLREERFHLAEAEILRAIEIEPAYLNARLLLAEIKLRQNDRAAAERAYTEFEGLYKKYTPGLATIEPEYARKLLEVNQRHRTYLAQKLLS